MFLHLAVSHSVHSGGVHGRGHAWQGVHGVARGGMHGGVACVADTMRYGQ